MKQSLIFNKDNYTVETIELEGKSLTYRAFENIPYVTNPADDKMQRLSIFVPEAYYKGKTIGDYSIDNAPIFMPNTVGGYMPGAQERPGKNFMGEINASFHGLLHGYVVVSPGVRGRQMKNKEGKYIGTAPAVICDLKAAVRYLRYNKNRIPGNTEKIISNGTSAGGASSSILGATGNHPDYDDILKSMGAAEEKDHIFAASCYCPITNLEHADMAYEWEFNGIHDYQRISFEPPASGEQRPTMTWIDEVMTEEQQKMSDELKSLFPTYLNSLNLKDKKGNLLLLDAAGNGSFKEYIKSFVMVSAQGELDKGADLSEMKWMTIENGKVTAIDFQKYVVFRTRMKGTPAFDNVFMGTPENELFGAEDVLYRHFTKFSQERSMVNGELAEKQQIKMMNPMDYIEDERAVKAKHYRIRHGAIDRDTSLAISAMLHAKLLDQGIDSDLAYPWGRPHSGDYDLDELFAWIDDICK